MGRGQGHPAATKARLIGRLSPTVGQASQRPLRRRRPSPTKSSLCGTCLDVSPPTKEPSQQPSAEELETARELVPQARSRGVALTGPDGLLKALTKTVIETALDEEMSEHLGYDKHERRDRIWPAPLAEVTLATEVCPRQEVGAKVCQGVAGNPAPHFRAPDIVDVVAASAAG